MMSNKYNPLVQHLRSDEVISNGDSQISKDFGGNSHPKLPNAATLSDGELSINMAKGYETIAIKNNNGEIVYIPFNVTGRVLDAENEINDIERKINESRWYIIPVDGIPKKDLSESVQESLDKADTAYQKPLSGIPASDLDEGFVQSKANIFDLGNMNVGDFLEKYSGEYLFKLWDYPTSTFPLVNDNKIHTIVYANDNNQEYYYDFIGRELVAKYDHRDVPSWIKNGFAINKQDILVSGSNIKTINGKSILGDGNIAIDTDSYKIIDLGEQGNFIEGESYYDGYYDISYSGTSLFDEVNNIWESGKIPIISFTLSVHGTSYSIPLYKKDSIFKAYGMYGGYGYSIDATIGESVSHIGIHPIANTVNGKSGNVILELEDIKPHDYSKDYLTFTALEPGVISFDIIRGMGTNYIESISYSEDNGKTWVTTMNEDDKENDIRISVNVNTSCKLLWKGVAKQLGYDGEPYYDNIFGSFFSSNCEVDICGNIMSMLYSDDFEGKTDLSGDGYVFSKMFYNEYSGDYAKLIDASNLILPSTKLTFSCYNMMFDGCSSLTKAPKLPATILAERCYASMFYNCTSLTKAPELPATTLAPNCYDSMFYGCTSLTTPPELPSTILASYCYYSMFNGCTSLKAAPELPSIILSESCYGGMFNGCTSLKAAPEIPSTTLARECYVSMFRGCISLTTAPELPSTTLANSCYKAMFDGCTSLTTAPELPATTLVDGCYFSMFDGCTSLNYIKCLATDISAINCLRTWVNGVSSTGTFIKNSSMTSWPTGINGIPEGWNIYTSDEYNLVRRYEIVSGVSHSFVKNIVQNTIWVDDFCNVTVEEMVENYINGVSGYSIYHLTQDTIDIDNTTYYIWENYGGDYAAKKAFILTTTNDYDKLLSQSLNKNIDNEFTSFGGFLNEDSEESYTIEDLNMNKKEYILQITKNNDGLRMYVDGIDIKGLGDERTPADYIQNPSDCGCNLYRLTENVMNIFGNVYYIWERDYEERTEKVRYLLTTTKDNDILADSSLERNINNVLRKNNYIYALMGEDGQTYETKSNIAIVKVGR